MINVKQLQNYTALFMVFVFAFGLYLAVRPKTAVQTPAFVYEEIAVTRAAAKAQAVPAPVKPTVSPLPIVPPKILFSVMPIYPAAALEKGVEGLVLVKANVISSGAVENSVAATSSGNADLDQAATYAVSQWRFSPAMQGASAVASVFEVPVRFTIK